MNFTQDCRVALAAARHEAQRLGHDYVGSEHLLLGLMHDPDGPASRILNVYGVGKLVVAELERMVPAGRATIALGELPYTARAKKAIELAMLEARGEREGAPPRAPFLSRGKQSNNATVTSVHLLIGILRDTNSIAALALAALGITVDRIRLALAADPTTESDAARSEILPAESATAFHMSIDDTSSQSIYEQIVSRVQEAVAMGKVAPGDRLPTVRRLADELDVAPGTVARAYAELEGLGVVVTEGSRGTRIAERAAPKPALRDLAGLLRPVAVAAYHMGASAPDLRTALEDAMRDIYV